MTEWPLPKIRNNLMISSADKLRAQFAPGDPVRFGFQEFLLKGTVIRLNPKRVVVQVDDEKFNVPYERLKNECPNVDDRIARIESVYQSASRLLQKHGLQDWQFNFDHSTRRAGACYFRNKLITLSFHLARSGTNTDIQDTLLHEIAHALVGREHHHDAVWKAKAQEIGCTGERTHSLQFAPPRWNVTCENHCWTQTAQQRNQKLICRTCGSKLVYSPYTQPA